MVSDIHRNIVKGQEGSDGENLSVSDTHFVRRRTTIHRCADSNQVRDLNCQWTHCLMFTFSTLGESPPPAPRACFGRDELIEKIVGLAESFTPVALVGPGGIGKTSIALTVLHHTRIRQRFGNNRRFIRCDQFTTSYDNFLGRLSKAVGAGVKNPEDLASLRPFLSSKEILIIFDNAESILDPRGIDAQEIYGAMEELSQFSNIFLCITSRISTIPSDCKTLNIPTLSIEAARDSFYRIYESGQRSSIVDKVLDQLDFHPLSITLLATVGHQNKWDTGRLAKEWERHRTSVLQTEHNKSLAITIELSLASPLFQDLGSDARAVLGVVAFFPQGVDENNLDWLFPTISNRTDIFDKFYILSLTYRSNGFITMLAPLRDYLTPKDPKSSSLLCTTKEHYFARMSARVDPTNPDFEETRWITSEDVNVEHLLDVFTTINASSDSVWRACADFMLHLHWHKGRLVILKPKIEGLPDDRRFKPECLVELSHLFASVADFVEHKRLLTHALNLQQERGNDYGVARMLREISDANLHMGFTEEGIQQAKESLEIFERLDNTEEQVQCLLKLASLLCSDKQFDAAKEAALRANHLSSKNDDQYHLCESHHVLGDMYRSRGKIEKAIRNFEAVIRIASPFNWHDRLLGAHYYLAEILSDEGRFGDANAHIERAKLHTTNSTYHLGCTMELQAKVWYRQDWLEEARSEALRAADVYERLGVAKDLEDCRELLRAIEGRLRTSPVVSSRSDSNCELL